MIVSACVWGDFLLFDLQHEGSLKILFSRDTRFVFFLNSSFYKKSFFSVGLDQINKHRTLKTYVVCVSLWICINNIKPKSLLREFILKTNFTNGSLVLLLSCIHERNFNQKSPSKRFWLFDRWPHQSQLVFLQRWQKPFKDFLSFFSM